MSQPESEPPSRGAVAAADHDLSDAEFAELDTILADIPAPLEPLDVVMLDGFLCGVIVQPTLPEIDTSRTRMIQRMPARPCMEKPPFPPFISG